MSRHAVAMRSGLGRRSRAAHQPAMTKKPRLVDWRLRVGATLGLLLGLVGGFELGDVLVQLNTRHSGWDVLEGLLLTFAGSAFLGVAFRCLVPQWRGVLRGLVGLIALVTGFGVGIIHSLVTQRLDADLIFGGASSAAWEFEWLLLIGGLFAGTWPGWMRPFYDRLVESIHWVVERPLRLVEACAQLIRGLVYAVIFFPQQLIVGGARLLQALGQALAQLIAPFNSPRRRATRNTHVRSVPLVRLPTRTPHARSSASYKRRANHNGGLRLIKKVEDRCP